MQPKSLASVIASNRLFWTFSFCLISVLAFSQQPGLRRPSVKYRQINTDTIRIIYPEGTHKAAQRIAHITTQMARQRPITGGAPLRKIDILLQNATDISNGYVGLGPWRSEFYLTPPQSSFELGSLQWHDLLAIHEYRHVQQISAMRTGISKWLYYLFGQEAFSGAKNVVVPDWFSEGDAVIAETVLTPQGRGRLPAFTNAFREMVADRQYWKYDKVRNGSLKELIPSEYPLGYLLVNYGREKFGQQSWDSIMVEAAAYKGLIYPFSKALCRRTGLKTGEFYHEAMDYYREKWNIETEMPIVKDQVVSLMQDDSTRYRDFSYPIYSADSTLYSMVEQFDQISVIVKHTDEGIEPFVTPGFQTESVFHTGGGKFCWTELRRHPRWFREDYSVVVVYDPVRKEKRTITHGSSYFMPALSADGGQIAVVADNDFQQYTIQILSAETGEVLRTLSNPQQYFYTHPQWTEDGRFIVTSARLPDGRMTLIAYDLNDEGIREFVPPGYALIGRPGIAGEWIYFTMTYEDVDQIFRVHRSARYFEQVTLDRISKYEPAIDPGTGDLIYAEYSLQGKKLVRMDMEQAPIRLVRKELKGLEDPVLETDDHNMLSMLPTADFTSTKYPLLSRPIRIHSWRLSADDPVYSFELVSENTLNTVQLRGGWEYNQNSGFHGPFTEVSIGLWYPEIVAGYSATRIDRIVQDQEVVWWQHVTNAGLRIPFYGFSGPYSQFGTLSSRYNHITTQGDLDFKLDYLSHTIQFQNARKQAYQHLGSRFSQTVSFRVLHAIDTTSARQYHVTTDFTVPSPMRNHHFNIEFDYRHEPLSNSVRFGDAFEYARGYDPIETANTMRLGFSYHFPVCYPDFGIAGIVYFRRIRLAPFLDYMRADNFDFRSVGSEILVDVNLLNVEPVTVGLRWAKRLDLDRGNDFSIILPVGF